MLTYCKDSFSSGTFSCFLSVRSSMFPMRAEPVKEMERRYHKSLLCLPHLQGE